MSQNFARMNNVGTVDQAKRFSHVMVCDQNADPTGSQVPDKILNIADGDWINASERLIEQHEGWVGRKRAGNFKTTALTARKGNGRRLAQLRDVKLFQQLIELVVAFLGVRFMHLKNGLDVVFDRQSAENRCFLRQIPYAEAGTTIHRHGGDVVAVNGDLARINRHETGNHIKAGRLAGAVRPQQAHGFAAAYNQRNTIDDASRVIGFRQAMRDQRAFVACLVSTRRRFIGAARRAAEHI